MRLKQHGDTRRNGPPGGRTPVRDRVRTGFTDHCASSVYLCQASLNRRVRKRRTTRLDRRTTGEPSTRVGVRALGIPGAFVRRVSAWWEHVQGWQERRTAPCSFHRGVALSTPSISRSASAGAARCPAVPPGQDLRFLRRGGCAVVGMGNACGQCIVVAEPNDGQATVGVAAPAATYRQRSAAPWPIAHQRKRGTP